MTQWRLFSNHGEIVSNGGNEYLPVFGAPGVVVRQSSTEADTQIKAYTAYTFSDMRVECQIGGSVATMRFNADGTAISALDVSLSGSAWFETIASGSVAADSLINYELDSSAQMHGDFAWITQTLVTYEHASTDSPLLGGCSSGSESADTYADFGTQSGFTTTEVERERRFQRPQALNNLRVNCTVASTLTSTFALRKDGVTSSTVTMSVSGTGIVEDAAGSESYASGEDGAFIWDFSAGSGTLWVWQVQMDTPETFLSSAFSATLSTRKYLPFSGANAPLTADDDYNWRGGASTAGSLSTYISDAGSGTRDVTFRFGSTNSTALTISVTTTGYSEDIIGSESVAEEDSVQITAASTGSSIDIEMASIELPWSDPSGEPPAVRRVMITSG